MAQFSYICDQSPENITQFLKNMTWFPEKRSLFLKQLEDLVTFSGNIRIPHQISGCGDTFLEFLVISGLMSIVISFYSTVALNYSLDRIKDRRT